MTEYYSIQSSQDVIEHHGVKGMKWGRRMAKGIKSWMSKQNEKYYDSHNGLLNDYYYQKKKNNLEWKAVQRHTGTKTDSFAPPSKEILQRQKAEYEKLREMKKEINDLNIERYGRYTPKRDHIKKEHLDEYDKLDKITNKRRPYNDSPKLERWDKAYDRQIQLTKIGMEHKYRKAKKAYRDYINK